MLFVKAQSIRRNTSYAISIQHIIHTSRQNSSKLSINVCKNSCCNLRLSCGERLVARWGAGLQRNLSPGKQILVYNFGVGKLHVEKNKESERYKSGPSRHGRPSLCRFRRIVLLRTYDGREFRNWFVDALYRAASGTNAAGRREKPIKPSVR